jgi:hypothetical protein
MAVFEVTETRTATTVYRVEASNEDDARERYERDGEFRDYDVDQTLVDAVEVAG